MNKHYKYIHVFWSDTKCTVDLMKDTNPPFLYKFADVITDDANNFNPDDHLFVTPYKNAYEFFSHYFKNVEFLDVKDTESAKIIDMCAPYCDWLILHAMSKKMSERIKIKNKYCHKIVWRTWGGVLEYNYSGSNPIKKMYTSLCNKKWEKKVRKFKAIGVANVVDVVAINNVFGKVKTYPINYKNDDKDYELLKEIKSRIPSHGGSQPYRILIGHSAYEEDMHILNIDRLSKFKDENVQFIFVLCNKNNDAYKNQVIKYAKDVLGEKAVIIDKYVTLGEYIRFLNEIDVAILDGRYSNALGNITMLAFLEKKIYLNKDSVIREAFDVDKKPYRLSCDIESTDFQEFVSPLKYDGEKGSISVKDMKTVVKDYHKLFDDLENDTKKQTAH